MGDMRNFAADTASEAGRTVSIDPYALVDAIMAERRQASSANTITDGDYDELLDIRGGGSDNNRDRDRNCRDRSRDQSRNRSRERRDRDREDRDRDREDRDRNRDDRFYGPRPDSQPKNVCVGAANPFAVVEALLGRKIDRTNVNVARILADVLQTDYDELFDMRHESVLYAGLKLNERERRAERFQEKEMKILNERDLITPDLSRVNRLRDLEKIGMKDLEDARVKVCRLQNGKLRLVLHAERIGRTVTNRDVTVSINDLLTPFRRLSDENDRNRDRNQRGRWTPPNGSWRDGYDVFFQMINRRLVEDITMFRIGRGENPYMPRFTTYQRFDDPTQGCSTNSWLIAAIFSVFWADPQQINRDTRLYHNNMRHGGGGDSDDEDREGSSRRNHRLSIKFHDKGGDNNNKTQTVDVNYEIPLNNSNNQPLYCRSSDGADIWPSLYEKAFAKWISEGRHGGHNGDGNQNHQRNSDRPDITITHSGDPIKAMAQINGRDPHYFHCERHSASHLVGLVRANCVSLKTINPMTAFTHATGRDRNHNRNNRNNNNDSDRDRDRDEEDMLYSYRGCNVVANHAYSVLGYSILGDRQYVVLRNPWGVTEPRGLTSYPGLVDRVEAEFWAPAALLDHGGLFALEAEAFKRQFAYIGVAK